MWKIKMFGFVLKCLLLSLGEEEGRWGFNKQNKIFIMIKNYFKIAWRNLWKNKIFSSVNIIGLSIGLTCCLLMALYIQHELSYDNFQAKGDRIVRVIMEYNMGGSVSKGNYTSGVLLLLLQMPCIMQREKGEGAAYYAW